MLIQLSKLLLVMLLDLPVGMTVWLTTMECSFQPQTEIMTCILITVQVLMARVDGGTITAIIPNSLVHIVHSNFVGGNTFLLHLHQSDTIHSQK